MSTDSCDLTSIILENLKVLRQQEQHAKQPFKVRAYNKAIKSIEEYGEPIKSFDDIIENKEKLPGIGKGIMEKMKEIIAVGYLERTRENVRDIKDIKDIQNMGNQDNEKSKKILAIELFSSIMSVGPVKASSLVKEHAILSIEQLRESGTQYLNEKQKLGLEYYEDFLERIPRKEMDVHATFLREVITRIAPQATFDIAGSYRRGAANSGDIDVLFTLPPSVIDRASIFQSVVKELKSLKYLKGDFAFGPEKYMGVCRLKRYTKARRLDLMYIPSEKYAFALLYFTGSRDFNIRMRNIALTKGLSLSEHGFKDAKTNVPIEMPNLSKQLKEHDVFDYLEMKWIEPKDR